MVWKMREGEWGKAGAGLEDRDGGMGEVAWDQEVVGWRVSGGRLVGGRMARGVRGGLGV